MDIINTRRIDRLEKIHFIKSSLVRAGKYDKKKVVMMCCSKWGISIRTANELIKVAEWEIENGSKN